MSYQSTVFENLFYVRWVVPEVKDVDRLYRDLTAAIKQSKGPLYYLAVSPQDSPEPNKEAREKLVDALKITVQRCAGVYLAFEAKGFKAKIKRSVITGILLASGKHRKVSTFQSEQDALDALREHVDVAAFLQHKSELSLGGPVTEA